MPLEVRIRRGDKAKSRLHTQSMLVQSQGRSDLSCQQNDAVAHKPCSRAGLVTRHGFGAALSVRVVSLRTFVLAFSFRRRSTAIVNANVIDQTLP
jgi:hypothetical protein